MKSLALALPLLVGCTGDKPAEIDANPLGPMCSKQTYDLCVEEHDCTTGNCQTFAAQNITVCTISCGSGCPPDKTGMAGTCESGICRPSAPNMCHL